MIRAEMCRLVRAAGKRLLLEGEVTAMLGWLEAPEPVLESPRPAVSPEKAWLLERENIDLRRRLRGH